MIAEVLRPVLSESTKNGLTICLVVYLLLYDVPRR